MSPSSRWPGRRWRRGRLRDPGLPADDGGRRPPRGPASSLPWFAWSVAQYGWHGTFLTNSSVTALGRWQGNLAGQGRPQPARHPRPAPGPGLQAARSSGSRARGAPFGTSASSSTRSTCSLALGSVGCVAVAREALRAARAAPPARPALLDPGRRGLRRPRRRRVRGQGALRDRPTSASSPVVLLGLAFLASRWGGLGRGWRAALLIGWTVDFCLGIALQFAVEDFALDRWLRPGREPHRVRHDLQPGVPGEPP